MWYDKYLSEFSNSINLQDFIVNILIATLLAVMLRFYYIYFGNSVSNRVRFANNFLPLALTTMLIITIVKSSLALSLGLVGALSIVRFRAAIKDPEELTFLFLVIGVGLATGANQPILAVLALSIILLLLYISKVMGGDAAYKAEDKVYVNITTDVQDLEKIISIISDNMTYVELKRMDTLSEGLDLSFLCKAKSLNEIVKLKDALKMLSTTTTLSVVDQPNLVV